MDDLPLHTAKKMTRGKYMSNQRRCHVTGTDFKTSSVRYRMGHDVRTTELTAEGHLVGLLDRDQRTVLSISATRFDGRRSRKSRGCDSFVVSATSSSSGGPATTSSRCLGRDRTSFRRGRRLSKDRRTNHQQQRSKSLPVQKPSSKWHLLNRTLNRLGEVLVIGVCLLTVVRIPSVMSAPIDRPRPKWINPCGLGSGSSDDLGGGDAELTEFGPRLTDHELLTQIVVTANNALSHAEHFREKYVKNTFNLDMMEHHDAWKSSNYDWLPNLPKGLGEKVPEENLQTLELDSALKDTYEYLQMFAVGLEQVVIDQKENGGEFLQEFKDTEFKVRATLCEIQVAMVERNVTPKADVTREIMGEELRMMGNSSYRNLRDWLIFRDYMNGLEYVIQVFDYIKGHLPS